MANYLFTLFLQYLFSFDTIIKLIKMQRKIIYSVLSPLMLGQCVISKVGVDIEEGQRNRHIFSCNCVSCEIASKIVQKGTPICPVNFLYSFCICLFKTTNYKSYSSSKPSNYIVIPWRHVKYLCENWSLSYETHEEMTI